MEKGRGNASESKYSIFFGSRHSYTWNQVHTQREMGRSPCCFKEGLNKGAWTAMEDKILTEYIKIHGEGKWRHLPKRAGEMYIHIRGFTDHWKLIGLISFWSSLMGFISTNI